MYGALGLVISVLGNVFAKIKLKCDKEIIKALKFVNVVARGNAKTSVFVDVVFSDAARCDVRFLKWYFDRSSPCSCDG